MYLPFPLVAYCFLLLAYLWLLSQDYLLLRSFSILLRFFDWKFFVFVIHFLASFALLLVVEDSAVSFSSTLNSYFSYLYAHLVYLDNHHHLNHRLFPRDTKMRKQYITITLFLFNAYIIHDFQTLL